MLYQVVLKYITFACSFDEVKIDRKDGQKIIANYTESDDKVLTLKRCINSRDPKCMR